jgi:YbbR domain-containing protein
MRAMTFLRLNWRILLVSFVLACGFWYTVTVRDRLEVQAEVTLNYRGMPESLMVREGMLKNFTVYLRGPRELVKNLDARVLTYAVDLSHLRSGANVIALSAPRAMLESRALDVVGLVPNQLVLEVEGILESIVPLEPKFSEPAVANGLKAENLHASPSAISIRGPESVIRQIQSLKLDVPVELAATGDYQLSLPVSVPPLVTAAPGAVLVRYNVADKRTSVELERVLLQDAKSSQPYRIAPQKVSLTVELPETLKDNKGYLEKIRVVINVKDFPPAVPGEVKPTVELPEGARLVRISPAVLQVTKGGKEASLSQE